MPSLAPFADADVKMTDEQFEDFGRNAFLGPFADAQNHFNGPVAVFRSRNALVGALR